MVPFTRFEQISSIYKIEALPTELKRLGRGKGDRTLVTELTTQRSNRLTIPPNHNIIFIIYYISYNNYLINHLQTLKKKMNKKNETIFLIT